MSKRASIILSVFALLVGILIGGGGAAAIYGRCMAQIRLSYLTSEASDAVATLRQLQSGNTTNAVKMLEVDLDQNLFGLGEFLSDPQELRGDPLYTQVLERARDYRARYPHKCDLPEMNIGISNVCALVCALPDSQTNH